MSLPIVSRRHFLGATAGVAVSTALVGARPDPVAAGAMVARTTSITKTVDNVDASIVYSPPQQWRTWSGLASPRWYMGTARSSLTKDTWFEYTNRSCTRLRWLGTKGPDRGVATVYIDGTSVGTVNTYAPAVVDSAVVFDSGLLPSGVHTMRIVVTSSGWVECDAISVDEVPHTVFVVDDVDPAITYSTWPIAWGAYTGAVGRLNGTAHSTVAAGAAFSYVHPNCSRLVWRGSTDSRHGIADVFVDGIAVGVVDQFSASLTHGVAVFDSGSLVPGPHLVSVVARGAGRAGVPAAAAWVELDRLEITGDPDARWIVDSSQTGLIRYYGSWAQVAVATATGRSVSSSGFQGSAADLTFRGATIAWLGTKGPDHGLADVFVDGALSTTVDTYAPVPTAPVVLFSIAGLSSDRPHNIRVQVRGTKRDASVGSLIDVDTFSVDGAFDPISMMRNAADTEIALVQNRTKSIVAQTTWQPKAVIARAPDDGVTLTGGLLQQCFAAHVRYLAHCFTKPNFVDSDTTIWTNEWPSADDGRMLMGAGHALRWAGMLTPADTAILRNGLDAIVATNAARQQQRTDGFCLPWGANRGVATDADIAYWMGRTDHERANYDRAMWTRGMVAAIAAGSTSARTVLRGMYDWFNQWYDARPVPVPALVTYSLGMQGHIGSTLAYHSPVGTPDDLLVAERYYVQDWFLAQLRDREPLSFTDYPWNRPHSYLVIALEAYMDHYRATGAQKYLDAALGGWEMFHQYFMFAGGGTAISEAHLFPPQSYDLQADNNEFDGAIFWIHFNQRMHQLFPDDERYTNEIERCIYNVALAQQDAGGNHGIRYHARMQGLKQAPTIINTCCEVNGTGLYSRLPEMVYSVASDGVYVNLFESSTITCAIGAAVVTLTTATSFPLSTSVSHSFTLAAPVSMKLHIRVPTWATGPMAIVVNGTVVASGTPGSYAVIEQRWQNGDIVTYDLPAAVRVTRYSGFTQIAGRQRYAVEYGPVLLSYATKKPADAALAVTQPGGVAVPCIPIAANLLAQSLTRVADPAALQFTVAGDVDRVFTPYWKVQTTPISCYTVLDPPTA